MEKNKLELIEAMIKAANKMLDDAKSIHAPCKNAYKSNPMDGFCRCDCWRCRPDDTNR